MQLPFSISIDRQQPLARLLCRGDIVVMTLMHDGHIAVERRGGSREEVQVETGTVVFTSLIILRLRVGGRVESLVLPRVATNPEAHRRLRVWLRWRALTSTASGAA